MLARLFRLQGCHLGLQSVRGQTRRTSQGGGSVLEELALPAVELRGVEELLAARGILLTYETVW